MLPIVQAFLDDVIRARGVLIDHCRCFDLLHIIVSILSLGPTDSMKHVEDLQKSIIAHHRLFVKLYPSVIKPKFHQLLHIPENMVALGCLLSCFPTERKHRTVKGTALHVFRNFEHTVLHDLVAQQIEKLMDDSLYAQVALVNPSQVECEGMELHRAQSAHLPRGEVKAGDLILHNRDHVSEVVCFWSSGDAMIAEVLRCAATLEACCFAVGQHRESDVVDVDDIECPLTWAEKRPGIVRVCMPVVR